MLLPAPVDPVALVVALLVVVAVDVVGAVGPVVGGDDEPTGELVGEVVVDPGIEGDCVAEGVDSVGAVVGGIVVVGSVETPTLAVVEAVGDGVGVTCATVGGRVTTGAGAMAR